MHRRAKLDHCNKIIDGVILGDYVSACNKFILARFGVTHILTVGSGLMPKFQGKFVYKIVREYDIPSANLKQHWPSCYQFIDQAIASGGTVLIHCYAGISRSSSTVAYYLMKKHDLSLKDALNYIRANRWFINPNAGFMT
jgi:dual specificity protein phosphatase 1B